LICHLIAPTCSSHEEIRVTAKPSRKREYIGGDQRSELSLLTGEKSARKRATA